MIKKTNRMSLVEQVVEQIELLVEDGHWVVGEKIPPEMELMEQFDVSRNTLREAIRALVHAGLLETKQGSGTVVRATNTLGVVVGRHVKKVALLETLDVRFALEKQAAKLAAERFEQVDFTKMYGALDLCRDAAEAGDTSAFVEADLLFHMEVAWASGNQLLCDLYAPLSDVVSESVAQMLKLDARLLHDGAHHVALVRAMEQGNVAAVGEIVERQFAQLRSYVAKRER